MLGQPFTIPALLMMVFALPLILSLIPINRLYGFRTRKSMSDDALWYRINRIGGWLFLVSAAIYLLFALLFPMSGTHDTRFSLWLSHLLAFAIPLIASIVWLVRYQRRL